MGFGTVRIWYINCLGVDVKKKYLFCNVVISDSLYLFRIFNVVISENSQQRQVRHFKSSITLTEFSVFLLCMTIKVFELSFFLIVLPFWVNTSCSRFHVTLSVSDAQACSTSRCPYSKTQTPKFLMPKINVLCCGCCGQIQQRGCVSQVIVHQ